MKMKRDKYNQVTQNWVTLSSIQAHDSAVYILQLLHQIGHSTR